MEQKSDNRSAAAPLTITPIARMESPFTAKFGIPRQSGLAPSVTSRIIFEKNFASEDALRGLSEFSHLWLIWGFSENAAARWHPTVRPPRLGGNRRLGVFATRSPFRPNGLGLSSVKIEEIKKDPLLGPVILVSGADLLDGTPIYDIKPYISTDCHPEAVCGFQEGTRDYRLEVEDSALIAGRRTGLSCAPDCWKRWLRTLVPAIRTILNGSTDCHLTVLMYALKYRAAAWK